ncbi:P-loop containing nucleoside triphosphate hydrolase protein [Acaromyces ingoldii]|uniref:P-loop containing nucleoside triphosphate hydrolase protein n=1 Tax=Acaromyces ingoldii TaxID=215250 RepID=A0A316YF43_9BASI|nr:P-loop containing nucleoside triphosphate hydrolase protein [Acaromyces ingoldii]PWN87258.1 P-loop containing nucleoside triphosphate hydrolase protein [Acaromyces ingoldii]
MDTIATAFFDHSEARRINTNAVISRALREQHPTSALVTVSIPNCNLLDYATGTGKASFWPLEQGKSDLLLTEYTPPPHRTEDGSIQDTALFAKYGYRWDGCDFLLYLLEGRDGSASYPQLRFAYLLTPQREKAEALVYAAGRWTSELHDEVWVFDSGYWQKSAQLFASIRSASWDDVILDAKMKQDLIDDHMSFFHSKEQYRKFKVPWKRGVIYYGPPGNGKTISIKAMMHALYSLKDPIPSLYVRSLSSAAGPEYAIKQIFERARQTAPCYLIFEDLDSLVSDRVRSYFLNEVDGLKANDGIFMVGSTNHLDQLDPGIAKRPSRFDRKYLFSDPNKEERIAYCHFWQRKLRDNKDVAFPDILCDAIAGITDKFSFAFIQEAFVAALLAIARHRREDRVPCNDESYVSVGDSGSQREAFVEDLADDWVDVSAVVDLDKYILWREIKKQIKSLRKEFDPDASPP